MDFWLYDHYVEQNASELLNRLAALCRIPSVSAGSGPVQELCGVHGVPVASAGAGWANSLIHTPNESVRVADYLEAIRMTGRLLAEFAVCD